MTQNRLPELEKRVKGLFQETLDRREPTLTRLPGILGLNNDQGSAEVSGKPQWVYVRVGNDETIATAFNNRTSRRNGLPVIVGYDPAQPTLFQVLSTREVYQDVSASGGAIPAHHAQHEFGNAEGGEDLTYLRMRQMVDLMVYPTNPESLSVNVADGQYLIGPTVYSYAGGSLDLTSYVPAASAKWVLVACDENGPYIVDGTQGQFDYADIPDANDAAHYKLAAVLLRAGDTAITDWPNEVRFVDLRLVGARSSAPAGYVDWENCTIVAKSGGNYDTVAAGLAALAASDRLLILPGTWNENVASSVLGCIVGGLGSHHQGSGFGTYLAGADDVGPIVELDQANVLTCVQVYRILAGGSGDYIGIDASDQITSTLIDLRVQVYGSSPARDVYALKTATGGSTVYSRADRCTFIADNAARGGATVECGTGNFDMRHCTVTDTGGGTALRITVAGTGTYVFDDCEINGNVVISGAATVHFRKCIIEGDVTVAGSGATVYTRNSYISGDIAVGAGDVMTAYMTNQGSGSTISGAGTYVPAWLFVDEVTHTDHFFGPTGVNRAAYMRLAPSGSYGTRSPAAYQAYWTDALGEADYEIVEMVAFYDGVDKFGCVRTVAGGAGTLHDLRLGVGSVKTKYVQINSDGDITPPTDATVDGHDIDEMTAASNEPGGFPNRTDSVLSWVVGTRTLTIAPAVTSFDVWQAGVKYVISAGEDIIIADTNGLHVVYYDAGALAQILDPSHTQLDDIIINKAIVAQVYWNTNTNEAPIVADERHGCVMSGRTHEYLHDTRGAVWREGLTLSDYVEDTASDVALTFEVSNGEIYDEDVEVEITDGSAANQYEQQLNGGDAEVPVLYRDDVDGSWMEDAASTLPYKSLGAGRLAYNNDDGDGTFSQVEVTNNRFMSITLVATNDWQYPIKAIQGQNDYTSISSAIEDATNEILALGDLPTPEMVVLYRLVMQTGTAYGGTKKAEIVSVTDFRAAQISGVSAAAQDHGSLAGLSDTVDHPGYVTLDGLRPLTGPWSPGQIVTFTNTGLHILDTNASHDLIIAPGSDLTADRTLTLTTGDADRTVTLQGNPTLDDWFDQSVKAAASVDFAQVTLPDSGKLILGTGGDGELYSASDNLYIKNVAQDKNIYVNVNDGSVDATVLSILGATRYVGIGTDNPQKPLHLTSSLESAVFRFEASGGTTNNPWEFLNNQNTGRFNIKDVVTANVPFKMDPGALDNSLRIGVAASGTIDMVDVKLMIHDNPLTTSALGKLHVEQEDTGGAMPVVHLEQEDDSEEFIEFRASIGAGMPIQTGALGSYYGKARVSVYGVGFKYVALYDS